MLVSWEEQILLVCAGLCLALFDFVMMNVLVFGDDECSWFVICSSICSKMPSFTFAFSTTHPFVIYNLCALFQP